MEVYTIKGSRAIGRLKTEDWRRRPALSKKKTKVKKTKGCIKGQFRPPLSASGRQRYGRMSNVGYRMDVGWVVGDLLVRDLLCGCRMSYDYDLRITHYHYLTKKEEGRRKRRVPAAPQYRKSGAACIASC